MKKKFILPGLFSILSFSAFSQVAQWTNEAGKITSTGANIGIGTSAPEARLHISNSVQPTGGNHFLTRANFDVTLNNDISQVNLGMYRMDVKGAGYSYRINGMNNALFLSNSNVNNRADVLIGRATVHNNGYAKELNLISCITELQDNATVENLIGINIQQPTSNSTANRNMNKIVGLNIQNMSLLSPTTQNVFGVYVEDPKAANYFAGKLGIGTEAPGHRLSIHGNLSDPASMLLSHSLNGSVGNFALAHTNQAYSQFSKTGDFILRTTNTDNNLIISNNTNTGSMLFTMGKGFNGDEKLAMKITKAGQIGIGNDNPTELVDVKNGLIQVENTAGSLFRGGIKIKDYADSYFMGVKKMGTNVLAFEDSKLNKGIYIMNGGNIYYGVFGGMPANIRNQSHQFSGGLYVSGDSHFEERITIGENIDPATANKVQDYKLAVGGKIICEEVMVQLKSQWPDYVFSDSYKLRPLSELKTFIDQNNHLPEVPAATEVENTGIQTSQMLKIQMQKIEELTLYLIQMNEQISALQKENSALTSKVNSIEQK